MVFSIGPQQWILATIDGRELKGEDGILHEVWILPVCENAYGSCEFTINFPTRDGYGITGTHLRNVLSIYG